MTHAPVSKREDQNGEENSRPKHPDIDGGWGWWVVFASFMIHIVSEYFDDIFFFSFINQHEVTKTKMLIAPIHAYRLSRFEKLTRKAAATNSCEMLQGSDECFTEKQKGRKS